MENRNGKEAGGYWKGIGKGLGGTIVTVHPLYDQAFEGVNACLSEFEKELQ